MIFGVASFMLSFVYMVMSLLAFRHIPDMRYRNQAQAVSPWWVFHPTIYDEKGKRLCRYGRLVLLLNLLAFIAWLLAGKLSW